MSKLQDKVAIVTGASKGIGASIAKHLAAVRADVAKKAEIERLFAEAKKAFGRLDILVNNAGIYEFSPIEGVTEEHFHKQFNLNVQGLILTSQEGAKHFGPGALAGAGG